eukprot:scaffold65950_cov62-Phaeocystis_antarctica.AAC.6
MPNLSSATVWSVPLYRREPNVYISVASWPRTADRQTDRQERPDDRKRLESSGGLTHNYPLPNETPPAHAPKPPQTMP